MLFTVDCRSESDWLPLALEGVAQFGYAAVTGVLEPNLCERIRHASYAAQRAIVAQIGEARLRAAGELGILRLPMKYDPTFYEFLQLPEVLAVVDHTVSTTAILHLQNAFVLPSHAAGTTPKVFQNRYHTDFPRVLGGYLASINLFFAIDEFNERNGATLLIPASQQRATPPSARLREKTAVPVLCPAGSMVIFDSTLWHAAGDNWSGSDRLAVNHQFTRSYIKQQIDYVRALGADAIARLPERTQQLLGYYTRVVSSLDEYYQPAEKRLYRAGQG